MSSYQSIVFLSKLACGISFITLGVGIFFIPSDEEKILKMKERLAEKERKYEKALSEDNRSLNQSIPKRIKDVENNKNKDNINVFRDL